MTRTISDDPLRDSRIDQLLSIWEQRAEDGKLLTPAELCADCPELIPELERQLHALRSMNRLFAGAKTEKYDPDQAQTARAWVVDHDATSQARGHIPEIPGYEILGELGRGGMAVVYKARQVALNRLVALKMICNREYGPEELARFRGEALALAAVQHPNIVHIYDVGEYQGQPFLAIEFADGGNLEDKLTQTPSSPRTAAELIRTLALAVQAAHDRGILHRDLKPSNVLLALDGTPKIADFGVAKRLDHSQNQTRTGEILGTPSYMAPEQARGWNRELSPAMDVYALGAILYKSLTGRPPFLGASGIETLELVRSQEPVPPHQLQPKVPRPLETICLKCLEKVPSKRYATASALAEDLRRFLAHEPILAQPIGFAEHVWRWCRRHPGAAGGLAISLIAVLILAASAVWFTRQLGAELARTKAAEAELHEALARQIAERLDRDLRQLASIPESLAALLSTRRDWTEPQLDAAIRDLLRTRPRIFGMCVAVEPGQVAGRDQFALYVYRHSNELISKQLLPPSYTPPYRDWPWYRTPKEHNSTTWSEPYVGPGADNTPMVSYSALIIRDGKFAGVVTIDLALEFFQSLRESLDNAGLGHDSACFLLTRHGTFLRHPDPTRQFPAPDPADNRVIADPRFQALLKRLELKDAGVAEGVDFRTGRPAVFLFARVASAGWILLIATHPHPLPAGTSR